MVEKNADEYHRGWFRSDGVEEDFEAVLHVNPCIQFDWVERHSNRWNKTDHSYLEVLKLHHEIFLILTLSIRRSVGLRIQP